MKEQAEGIFDDEEQSTKNEEQPEVSGSSSSVNQVKRFDGEDSMDENEDVEEDLG